MKKEDKRKMEELEKSCRVLSLGNKELRRRIEGKEAELVFLSRKYTKAMMQIETLQEALLEKSLSG